MKRKDEHGVTSTANFGKEMVTGHFPLTHVPYQKAGIALGVIPAIGIAKYETSLKTI